MEQRSLSQRVAANLRAELARAGVSQSALAQKMNTTQQTVSRRMSGRVSFTLDELDSIANVLDVPLAKLLAEVAA